MVEGGILVLRMIVPDLMTSSMRQIRFTSIAVTWPLSAGEAHRL